MAGLIFVPRMSYRKIRWFEYNAMQEIAEILPIKYMLAVERMAKDIDELTPINITRRAELDRWMHTNIWQKEPSIYNNKRYWQYQTLRTMYSTLMNEAGSGFSFVSYYQLLVKYFNQTRDLLPSYEDIRNPPNVKIPPIPTNNDIAGMCQEMYDNNDYTAAPISILADALTDANAPDMAIEHLRQPNVKHYKGCWVVDKILGKR